MASRKVLARVAKVIEEYGDRISTQTLFDICHNCEPGKHRKTHTLSSHGWKHISNTAILVPRGGRAFEVYLETMATWKGNKIYRSFIRSDPDGVMDDRTFTSLMEHECGTFHGFIILTCGNINREARKERFHLSLIARYHGLSRKGLQLLSHFGFTIKMTTYDTMEKQALEHHALGIR